MSDLVNRLRDDIIIPAFQDGRLPNGKLADRLIRDRLDAADRIEALTAALQQISDMGPMSVDDQRWRIAREALTSGLPKALHPVASE